MENNWICGLYNNNTNKKDDSNNLGDNSTLTEKCKEWLKILYVIKNWFW